MFWIVNAASVAAAYLLGALPFGYWAGRILKGIDLREQGSGSTGATNVLRTLGAGPGAVVLLLDVAKGAAAVLLARWLWTWAAVDFPAGLTVSTWIPWSAALAGAVVLVGHSRSVFLGFKGGKSVAAGLGMLLAMSWPVAVAGLVVFAAVVAMWRMVSLGSILASLTAIVAVCLLDHPLPYRLMIGAGGLFVIWLHRANIRRLMSGAEPRVGQKSADSTTA